MTYISEKIIQLMERLAEMFPENSYQSRLESYLKDKGVTEISQVENYIKEFNHQQKGYL